MRLLDLYCGAGGAAKGYQRAGFYVVGVDIRPQPRYCGDEFLQMDALEYVRRGGVHAFDAIHASPPCQADSWSAKRWKHVNRVDLLAPTRAAVAVPTAAGCRTHRHVSWVGFSPLLSPATRSAPPMRGLHDECGSHGRDRA